ncbi:MAG: hypothetical protein FVQ81_15240 [Candidatus Glassbacteria bacterium]|nr:hypothetical protein [Candidatus Glassbacteria bacterium]
MDRRNWLARFGGILAAGGAIGSSSCGEQEKRRQGPSSGAGEGLPEGLNHYFGDLHNHCEVGYAQGSLARAYEIAEGHLDFFSCTPHSWWHDVPKMVGGKESKWLEGFEMTRRRWPEIQQMTRDYHRPGEFVTFPGYEWHSSHFGDFCIVFPDDDSPLTHYDELAGLQRFALEKNALLIPHHPAYLQGHRGANPEHWDPRVNKLLEIYSEHGNAESDEGQWDYIRHSMGGRWTPNTLQSVLKDGHRMGVLASSDDHLGHPGAYGEGLAAVLAPELTRKSLFGSLNNRLCYGVTGDRIRINFAVNGRAMGGELPFTTERRIAVAVEGWDTIERVEVLKNNRVVHREHPVDNAAGADPFRRPVLVRLEYGWGPWASLGIPRICDWKIKVGVQGGKITELMPGFQSGPLTEDHRNRIANRSAEGFVLSSYTSRLQAFNERPTNLVVMRIQGGPETRITLNLDQPTGMQLTRTLAELLEDNAVAFTGPFPDESLILHRAVAETNSNCSFSFTDSGDGAEDDWYYVRVMQRNNQLAWSSPVWVDRKA